MDALLPQDLDFFPSTTEHRPLHVPEKVALKQYFAASGAHEHEGLTLSPYANTPELADLEAWVWGLRFWGRECLVRTAMASALLLQTDWDAGLAASDGDLVSVAAAYEQILTPAEAHGFGAYWVHIPSEEKAARLLACEKPLPEEWFHDPLHAELQGKPFFWGALAGWHLILAIFLKRDPTAARVAQICVGAARSRMLAGRSPAAAVQEVRETIILALRKWMGYKW